MEASLSPTMRRNEQRRTESRLQTGGRAILALGAGLLLLATGGAAGAEHPVTPETHVSVDSVAPGDSFQVACRLGIRHDASSPDGIWHVQSHVPSEEFYIRTDLVLSPHAALEVGPVRFPEGEEFEAPLLGGVLSVYGDGVVFGADVKVLPEAAPGEHTLTGELTYQACNDKTCLFPKTVEVSFAFRVDPAAVVTSPAAPEVFQALAALAGAPTAAAGSAPVEKAPDAGSEISRKIESSGFSLWLLGIFALGLGLNLTPCVYPVIAVTISYFGRQEGGGGGQFVRALAYSAGIGATFTSLFLIAGVSGQLFGAWLQHPAVLAALAAVLVALALSNFGLFEIQAPAALRNRVAGGKQGILGALLMGFAMGIVTAPCVGPLIAGLLIWVGQQASLGTAGLVGATLSAGLALPYVVLGTFSGSLSSLPKSGDWMEWIKHAMGFVLLGVALYFLAPLVPPHWFLPAFAILAVVAGIWLAFFDKAGRSSSALAFARGVVITVALVAAFALLRLDRMEGIEWAPYEPEAVMAASDAGRPVIIDFTAAWCVPCKVMEHGAFKNTEVIRESERFVRLQVDLTHLDEPLAQEAVERFQVAGPPVIVFLAADGHEAQDLRVLESIGPEELLERMRRTRGTSTSVQLR